MNKKFLFYSISLIMMLGLTFTACTNNEELVDNSLMPQIDEHGYYVYDLDLNCDTPDYDEEGTTRAVSYTWEDNATLYVRFKDGSSYIPGTATYNKTSNKWTVKASSSLSITNDAIECRVFYFENPASVTDDVVNLTEQTIIYFTTTATYKHPTSSSISITATLRPYTWRMRFKGTNGTKIKLPGNENGINYYTTFERKTGYFTHEKRDVTLSVSGGYTPYIYGEFESFFNSDVTDNPITLINNTYPNYKFSRTMKMSDLSFGTSGYFNIPTSSSYSGWVRTVIEDGPVTNCAVGTKDMVTFTDAIVTGWNVETNVDKFYYKIYTSLLSSYTDEEIISSLKSQGTMRKAQDVEGYIYLLDNLSPNTTYYLYTVGLDSNGKPGTISIIGFKTLSSSLPYAEISNIQAASSTKWTFDITLKNNAQLYYLLVSTDESDYNMNWHFMGYFAHQMATSGQLDTYNWSSVQTTVSSGSCSVITICTWGVSSSGSIGDCRVSRGSVSSAPQWTSIHNSTESHCMKKYEKEAFLRSHKLILMNEN